MIHESWNYEQPAPDHPLIQAIRDGRASLGGVSEQLGVPAAVVEAALAEGR